MTVEVTVQGLSLERVRELMDDRERCELYARYCERRKGLVGSLKRADAWGHRATLARLRKHAVERALVESWNQALPIEPTWEELLEESTWGAWR